MNEQTSTTLLTGWIHPGECYFRGDDLYMQVNGTFAGEHARITLCLGDAHHHGFPTEPDDRITRAFGNWLELAGAFQASPIDDQDCDPEHTGYLTVAAVSFSHRVDAGPRSRLSDNLARKTITALFPAGCPRIAAQPQA
jgi:hypothetical protein